MERILLSWPMVERKRSNLESSRAAARQKRKLRSAAEAEALAKSTRHDDDPDRISELPNSVLHHILSFLDMKHVIHTAFLSKRWTRVFKSLPSLSLDQDSYETTRRGNDIYDDIHSTKFIDFVDRVLCLRDSATHSDDSDDNDIIRSLHVSWFENEMNMNRITPWIDFAERHNVQDLEFTLTAIWGNLYNGDLLLALPNNHPSSSLFSCKLLTTLNLWANETALLMIPHDLVVDLPKLKTLHLRLLSFNGEKINENFFSRCPLLEKLIIEHCQLEVGNNLNILLSEDHPLKYLKIDSLHKLHNFLKVSYITTISAPKLTSLWISVNASDYEIFCDYNLVNMHSLVEVQVFSSRNQIKFLNSISNVKSLTLSAAAVGVESDHARLKNMLFPFHNLRMLKLLMSTSFEIDEICRIAYLLRKCPTVKTLVLERSTKHPHEHGTIVDNECGKAGLSSSSSSFKFRLDHLKFIKIRGFTGCMNELEFLIFMLMHTPVLEKMFMYVQKKHLTPQNMERCRTMLDKSPRASSKTKFFFLQSFKYDPMYGVRYWG